jgi:hypothetical protein
MGFVSDPGIRIWIILNPVDGRHDEEPEGTELLVCGASFVGQDGTEHTCTLLPGHASDHTDIPGPSVTED